MAKKQLIHPEDIQRITGASLPEARATYAQIQEALQTKNELSLQQYCKYVGLPEEQIRDFLQGDTHHSGLDID